jgi:hypothetical protein
MQHSFANRACYLGFLIELMRSFSPTRSVPLILDANRSKRQNFSNTFYERFSMFSGISGPVHTHRFELPEEILAFDF